MKKLNLNHYSTFILSVIILLTADLVSKYYILHTNPEQINLIKNYLSISLQTNRGVAFGVFFGYTFQLVVSIIILGLLVYFGLRYILQNKTNRFINELLLGIIVGGAIGNIVNRIHLGYVVDFISLRPIPVFNIADIGITVGIIIFFILNLRD